MTESQTPEDKTSTDPAILRWLITGANGQLGYDLTQQLTAAGAAVLATDVAELDILDSAAVARAISDFAPDVVVNAAAYTAVDSAETNEDAAYRINATGPAVLAAAVAAHGGVLVHVSTDYVFPGDADTPYEVDDPTGPATAYGRTKLAGELAVRELLPDASYVVRTAWVYGAHSIAGNFVKTMIRLEGSRETLTVVDDQRGSPTYSADLAAGLIELAASKAPAGIYHCTGTGDTTWCQFAKAIFAEIGADPDRVQPTTSAAYASATPRPSYSVLSARAWQQAGLTPMRPWQDALSAALSEHREQFQSS